MEGWTSVGVTVSSVVGGGVWGQAASVAISQAQLVCPNEHDFNSTATRWRRKSARLLMACQSR